MNFVSSIYSWLTVKANKNPFEVAILDYCKRKKLRAWSIYIPETGLLDSIYEIFGASNFDELFPSQKDFDDIAMSLIEISKFEPRQDKIHGVKVISKTSVFQPGFPMKIDVYYVEGLILGKRARKLLEKPRGGRGLEYEKMPKDVFHHLVLTGGIRGKDLLALCSANREIRRKCDADDGILFKKLLIDSHINWPDGSGRSAKETYESLPGLEGKNFLTEIFWARDEYIDEDFGIYKSRERIATSTVKDTDTFFQQANGKYILFKANYNIEFINFSFKFEPRYTYRYLLVVLNKLNRRERFPRITQIYSLISFTLNGSDYIFSDDTLTNFFGDKDFMKELIERGLFSVKSDPVIKFFSMGDHNCDIVALPYNPENILDTSVERR